MGVWVLSNIAAKQNRQQIEYLVQSGCIGPLVQALSLSDVKVIEVALEGLYHILGCGKKQQMEAGLPENPIVSLIEMDDGISKIEALQESPKEVIYQMALKILELYFPLDDDDDSNVLDA